VGSAPRLTLPTVGCVRSLLNDVAREVPPTTSHHCNCYCILTIFELERLPTFSDAIFFCFFFEDFWTRGRNPLDEESARRKGIYLHRTTPHKKHKRQTSISPEGFEPAIPVDQDLRLTPRGHWDQLLAICCTVFKVV
jgi:hypothetical protein